MSLQTVCTAQNFPLLRRSRVATGKSVGNHFQLSQTSKDLFALKNNCLKSNIPFRFTQVCSVSNPVSNFESSKTIRSRSVLKVEKFLRLPVWPVVPGLFYILLDLLRLTGLAAFLEQRTGGRVCPMFFAPYMQTDPFIMCVHHRHSFWWWDPIRPIFRLLMPEGFPAHPHRGFETVTYMLDGALTHRDSTGVKQRYGKESAQWMTAGRGMLHEEMWDTSLPSHELYQIWVNLPSASKMAPPRSQLIGDEVTLGHSLGPIPTHHNSECTVRVLGGSYGNTHSPVQTHSPIFIFRVTVQPGGKFQHSMPPDHSCTLYVRRGKAVVTGEEVGTFSTAFLDNTGEIVEVVNEGKDELDFLLLGGQRLKEPIATGGSMVMTNDSEISQAYENYNKGTFGVPWDHTLTDDLWEEHVRKYESLMR